MDTEQVQGTEDAAVAADLAAAREAQRFDAILTSVMWGLGVALLALVVLFGWTWWSDRAAERAATPATRSLLDLEKAVRADSQNANLRVRYGEALASAGLYDKAADQLTAALKLNPDHTGALVDLGIIAMEKTQYDTAEGYFQRVIDMTEGEQFQYTDERRELALFYMGEIALTQKRYEDAVPYFKAALRIRRDAADSYFELALAYIGMDSTKQAKEQLNIALTFDPNYAQARYEYGKLLLGEGNELGAAEQFGIAYAKAPDNQQVADAVEQLGPVEKRMAAAEDALAAGDAKTALYEAKLASYLDVLNFDAKVLLARAYEASGDKKGALAIYKEADSLKSGDASVTAAIARLGAK